MAKRIAAALIFVLSILGLILWPKLVMLRCLSSDGRAFGALRELRGKVAAYRETHGRFPADLAEVGVPALDLYSYDPKSDRVHRHHRIRETVVRPGAGLEDFTVHFSTDLPYRPDGAAVVGDFNDFDRERGRMSSSNEGRSWTLDVPMKPGRHSFRFVVGKVEQPLETLDIDHATRHPNVYATHAEMPVDEGKWIYDPQTGLVFLGCSGTDTKHRRPWYFY